MYVNDMLKIKYKQNINAQFIFVGIHLQDIKT